MTVFPMNVPMSGVELMAFNACIQGNNHNNTLLLDGPVYDASYKLAVLNGSVYVEIQAAWDRLQPWIDVPSGLPLNMGESE